MGMTDMHSGGAGVESLLCKGAEVETTNDEACPR